MPRKLRNGPVWCGLILIGLSGCYAYPYSPYGVRGYPPGMYTTPPVGTVQPGTTYLPPGATGAGSAQAFSRPTSTVIPGATNWQPAPGIVGSQSNAPLYNSTGSPELPNAREDLPPSSDGYFDGTNGATERDPGVGAIVPFGETDQGGVVMQGIEDVGAAPGANVEFVAPIPLTPTSAVPGEAAGSAVSVHAQPSPYLYDHQNFQWLRGVVQYAPTARAWQITYDPQPDPKDQFGGRITLTDHQGLDLLHNNDVVLVDGNLDQSAVDLQGNPRFRVSQVTGPLIPEQHTASLDVVQ